MTHGTVQVQLFFQSIYSSTEYMQDFHVYLVYQELFSSDLKVVIYNMQHVKKSFIENLI